MNKVFGIDVSKWQRGFDFGKAKNEGAKFVIIKASQRDFKDSEFEAHYKNAVKEGFLTGAYHYLTATDVNGAMAEAKFMIGNCLKGKSFDYPIFADAEDAALKKLDKKTVDEIITAFCNTLEAAGYWAGFYCSYDFYKNHCSGEELSKRYSLWLASWTEECPADCQMWQFGGETNLIRSNKVAGVVCDQNYSFTDYPSLIKAKGLNGYTAAVSKPVQSTAGGVSAENYVKVGSRVRLKNGAPIYGTDKRFASWVYNSDLYLRELVGSRAVVSTQKTGAVTGAVDVKYIISAE